EDGIRAFHVTGVQTCALPILIQHNDFCQPPVCGCAPAEKLTAACLPMNLCKARSNFLIQLFVFDPPLLGSQFVKPEIEHVLKHSDRKSVVEGKMRAQRAHMMS